MGTMRVRDQLIDALLKTGRIAEDQAAAAITEKRGTPESMDRILVRMGIVKEQDFGPALETYFKVPYVNLTEVKIDDVVRFVPEYAIRKYLVIPIDKNDNELSVAMCFPDDIVALDDLRIITGYAIKPMVALESGIAATIDHLFSPDIMERVINDAVTDKKISDDREEGVTLLDIKEAANKAPIVTLVDAILAESVRIGASDIHMEPQEKGVFIRYRVDGLLYTKEYIPKELQLAVTSRIKIMGNMDITEKRLPQDGQTRMTVKKRDIDFRISTLPAKHGEKIVIRVLDKSNFALGIEHLGFSPEAQTKFEEMLKADSGIILVTGPTGSGKTTTLYSALNRIKSTTKSIITLEDPIEYDLLAGKVRESGITQVQINAKIGLTFANSLRACLRQDPDVILVGEVRDEETCRIAINAALMGRLVLSTIHTNDAVSTITRLLDMGIEPYLIVSSLRGLVAQRLLRTLCRTCREPYQPPARVLKSLGLNPEGNDITFYRPKGCERCGNGGYKGRIGIVEVLPINETLRDAILEKRKLSTLRELAQKSGMTTMKQHGIQLVSQGITSMAEIMRVLPATEQV